MRTRMILTFATGPVGPVSWSLGPQHALFLHEELQYFTRSVLARPCWVWSKTPRMSRPQRWMLRQSLVSPKPASPKRRKLPLASRTDARSEVQLEQLLLVKDLQVQMCVRVVDV